MGWKRVQRSQFIGCLLGRRERWLKGRNCQWPLHVFVWKMCNTNPCCRIFEVCFAWSFPLRREWKMFGILPKCTATIRLWILEQVIMVIYFDNFEVDNDRGLNSPLVMSPTMPKPWTCHWIMSQMIQSFLRLGIKFWLKLDPMCEWHHEY